MSMVSHLNFFEQEGEKFSQFFWKIWHLQNFLLGIFQRHFRHLDDTETIKIIIKMKVVGWVVSTL